jgi:hypothetical protein
MKNTNKHTSWIVKGEIIEYKKSRQLPECDTDVGSEAISISEIQGYSSLLRHRNGKSPILSARICSHIPRTLDPPMKANMPLTYRDIDWSR